MLRLKGPFFSCLKVVVVVVVDGPMNMSISLHLGCLMISMSALSNKKKSLW